MRILSVHETLLPHFSSGSLLDAYQSGFLLGGDDSGVAAVLDLDFCILQSISLGEASSQRIPKKEKADWEAGFITSNGTFTQWIMLGSGSLSPQRDKICIVNPALGDIAISSLTTIYQKFRQHPQIKELNIEAAARVNHNVCLGQRGGLFQDNLLLILDENFWENQVADFTVATLSLPTIKGCAAGISGMDYDANTDTLWFCASAEQTTNAYDDGEIVGSAIGCIHQFSEKKAHLPCLTPNAYAEIPFTSPLKLESITLHPSLQTDTHVTLAGVADNDDGMSRLYKINIALS